MSACGNIGPILRFFLIIGVVAAFSIGRSARSEQPADSRSDRSTSVGTPMNGNLLKGVVLPWKGTGYRMTELTRKRRARFGVQELVLMVKKIAIEVASAHKGSILGVADLSAYRGGPIDHHGSHQNGRDVDLLFYIEGRKANFEYVPIDANGFSTDPPMKHRFDRARNWALVRALIESKEATVQWIFVADHVKKILLEQAAQEGAPKALIRQAEQLLHEPGGKGHPDHFHVRIHCPVNDMPECKEIGPIRTAAR